jgi:type II secretory ATPase GspE/PulE/Tfp pilus assembly ATPase PilB-like protein
MFPGEHWLTVEDPIERRIPHPNVTQVDAMSRTGDDEDTAKEYNHALLAALRAAPDCLYLGEIRSTDTAEIAIRSALTGHPVYSTIHTDGAMKGVARLIDLGIDKTLLLSQSVVKGITSQRLLRELCDCGRIIRRSDWTFFCPPWLHKVFEERGAVRVANHEGCPRCNQGYRPGRQVINEIFIPTRETMRYLVEGRDDMALAAWKEQDGKPLVEIAAERVAIGVADPFDVLRSVNFD